MSLTVGIRIRLAFVIGLGIGVAVACGSDDEQGGTGNGSGGTAGSVGGSGGTSGVAGSGGDTGGTLSGGSGGSAGASGAAGSPTTTAGSGGDTGGTLSGGSGGSAGVSGAAGSPTTTAGSGGEAPSGGAAGLGGGAGVGGSPGGAGGGPSACGPVAPKVAPPLALPTGTVVEVSTVDDLMSAVGSAADGTTILLADGTYYLPGLLRFRNYQRDITLRSSSGNRDAVIIDGSQSSSDEMIWFEEVENVTVADMTVQNANVHCFTVKGEADANGVRIYNVKIRHCWERYVKGTAPNPISAADPATRPRNGRIEYCLFEQDYPKQQDDWTGGDYIGGIDMMWLQNWVISDNVFLGIQGRNNQGRGAIFIWNESEDVVVERNYVFGCDTGIAFGNPSGAALHVTRGIMRDNMVTRGNYKAIELARTSDCEIYNNTVYSESLTWDRAFHSFQGSDGIHIHSNLVHAWGVRLDDPVGTVENNLEGDLSGYFVDPTVGDLHLTATGAAAVLGQGLSRPSGAMDYDAEPRPDPPAIGADECVP